MKQNINVIDYIIFEIKLHVCVVMWYNQLIKLHAMWKQTKTGIDIEKNYGDIDFEFSRKFTLL